jgi:two-component system response regulator GlrR
MRRRGMDKILVVDDDETILKLLKMRLEAKGYEVFTAPQSQEALKIVETEAINLALVDLKLDEENGIDLMKNLHQINPILPIIILTAFGTVKTAVEAMSKGAYSYLTKPFDNDELLLQIKNCLDRNRLSVEVKKLRGIIKERYGFDNIVGKSEKMKTVLELVTQAAETDSVVYISGESGTGKELIAKNLHLASPRRDGPFVPINCAAIPETLLESELFGYEKGAFTGASKAKKGLFAQAHKGTFFLDEISEMSLNMQAKLLRVLEEGEFYPLGGGKPTKADVRVIAASNKNLDEEVENGRFRKDLFYRINVIRIALPPLRERKEDVPLLAKHFLKRISKKMRKEVAGFSPNALRKMIRYQWPGNVRELENTIESAVAMSLKNVITKDLILQTQELEEEGLKSFKEAKWDFEKNYLTQLIEFTQGNVTNAARLAGKHRADLYELFRKHNLDPADFREKRDL